MIMMNQKENYQDGIGINEYIKGTGFKFRKNIELSYAILI